MKKILLLALLLGLHIGVQAQENEYFGKKIKEKGAIPAAKVADKLGDKDQIKTKVTGTVESVCKVKGCWMKVVTEEGETMRVTFKDYGFFVPKDIIGKTVVFEGEAKKKTTPVEELQHYAKDAGKSKEEIASIKEPLNEVAFVAEGVILKK